MPCCSVSDVFLVSGKNPPRSNNLRYNCLMLSYRGYGLSEGSPTEKGIKTDAQTALDFVTNHEGLKNTPLVSASISRL